MSTLDIRIMASPKRASMANALANAVGGKVVFDDRPNGGDAMYTAKKAWLSISGECTHGIVLQDDAEVVNRFNECAALCADAFPGSIFSFYCAKTKMRDFTLKTPYVRLLGDHCVAGGVAVMMPREMIVPCFKWISQVLGDDYRHDDAAIGMFAQAHDIKVFTTIPSLIQHLCPTQSLVGLNNYKKVSQCYIGKDIDFVNFKTREYKTMQMNSPWCVDGAAKGSKAYNYMKSLKERRKGK